MTESDVDVITPVISELKGDSRLVVLLGSPEGIKSTSKKLSAHQDVKKIRRGLLIIHGHSENHSEILNLYPIISFIKTREIPSIRKREDRAYSNRAYTIVTFSFNNPTAQQKKRVERLIKKTAGIRLRPGVIIFPLLRSKERRRILGPEEERFLLDSAEFSKLVRETGGTTIRWTRLRIFNLEGDNHIKDAIEQTLSRDLHAIEGKIQTLRERCKDPTISISQLKKNYTVLSRNFRTLKTKWILAKRLWYYDAEKVLKRTYNMLINTRRAIQSRDTTNDYETPVSS